EIEQIHRVDVEVVCLPDLLLDVAATTDDRPEAYLTRRSALEELAQDHADIPVLETVAEKEKVLPFDQSVDVRWDVAAGRSTQEINIVLLRNEVAVIALVFLVDATMHLENDRTRRLLGHRI